MDDLLSKQGKTIRYLASILLNAEPGHRLVAMQQIADEQDVSVGTVQAAMQYLQNEHIVQVANRGRLGAFAQALDYPHLWALARQRPMSAILPMPYSLRVEGLATALRQAFDAHALDIQLRYMRGSTARIERLTSGQCDWVITSRYAAEAAAVSGFEVEPILALGPGSYTIEHVLLIKGADQLQPGMRVGIDTQSADHAYVVRLLSRGTPVSFVEIDYSTTIEQLLSGQIDATVWTEPDVPTLPEPFRALPVGATFAEDDKLGQLGEAVIIGLPAYEGVAHVVQAVLAVDSVREVQQAVVERQVRPTY
ncbi:MAG: hypothetical protein CL607_17450 [Anaerolineaceae bacterium]|nr:hypothetical protein [Anaerolineaceae bacterium]